MSTISSAFGSAFTNSANARYAPNCDMRGATTKPWNDSPTAHFASCIERYFELRLKITPIKVRFAPAPILDGWEAESYQLVLESPNALPEDFRGSLVLRIYGNKSAIPRLDHEFSVQKFMQSHGFPSPEPLLLEESSDWLGGPFLVRKLLPGQSLYDFIITPIWRLWQVSRRTGFLLARLHQLPTDEFPAHSGDMLEHSFADMQETMTSLGFKGLEPGLHWLQIHRPAPPEKPCIVHLDFHPKNIIIDDDWNLSLVDWSEATLGDPHADFGCMEAIIRCAAIENVPLTTVPFVPVGRYILCKRIRKAYRELLPIDEHKLNYYRAWAAMVHLCREGWWLFGKPELAGGKRSTRNKITPRMIRSLEQFFERYSNVRVHLPV